MKHLYFSSFIFCLTISVAQAQKQPYLNPNLSAHARVVHRSSRLTLEERAQLMLD